MNIPKVMMNNGLEIPIVGLGTWQVMTHGHHLLLLFYVNS